MARDKYDDLLDGSDAQPKDKYDELLDGGQESALNLSDISGGGIGPAGIIAGGLLRTGVPQDYLSGIVADKTPETFAGKAGQATPGIIGFDLGGPLGAAGMEAVRQHAIERIAANEGRERGILEAPAAVATQYGVGRVAKFAEPYVNRGIAAAGNKVAQLGEAVASRLPSTLKQYFGIAEPITDYVVKRGSGNVFTPQNLNQGAAQANVGEAARGLAQRRSDVGGAIGRTEDFILQSGGNVPINLAPTENYLSSQMATRGYTDPRTAGLARGKDFSLLDQTQRMLRGEPRVIPGVAERVSPILDDLGRPIVSPGIPPQSVAPGQPTLQQAINAKRLIGGQLEFSDQLSSPAVQLAKTTEGQIVGSIRAQVGSGLSGLYDDFGKIVDAQEKLAEFTGQRMLSGSEQRAVNVLRGIILKNPAEIENVIKVLGGGLPGGQAQARQIIDAIVAESFTRGGIGAPSSTLLKTITAGGLLSGQTARTAVGAAETLRSGAAAVGQAAQSPLAREYARIGLGIGSGVGAAKVGNSIADYYSRKPAYGY